MRSVLMYIAVWVVLVCACGLVFSEARADEYVSVMVGVFSNGKHSLAETKFANLGHREYLGLGISEEYELGGWVDTAGGGRGSSAYAAYQIGFEAVNGAALRFFVGPAVITSPDSYLGAQFPQFTEDFFLGVQGKNGDVIGFKYKHISSAGFSQPNQGRDFAGIEASIKF